MSYSTVAMDRGAGRCIDAVAMCAGVPWLRIWVVLCVAPVMERFWCIHLEGFQHGDGIPQDPMHWCLLHSLPLESGPPTSTIGGNWNI